HEMGHVLGLWHVHRGVSEVECHDDCLETRASLDTGDLCEDTGPTPMNHQCHDPPADLAHCGLTNFVDTPFRNYMGYGDDACTSVFSQQQVARMHCYADLFYGSWQPGAGSSRIPEPPMAPVPVVSGPHSVTLSWAPSVASVQKDQCSLCTETRALSQYAIRATDGANHRDAWEPRQATGPPDADVCTLSYRAWLPAADTCNDRRDCSLTLELESPVVPAALSLWMPWNSREGLSELVLVYADQSEHIMKDITAYCDMPYTMQLD
ncbi:pregnancy-associated plasma protein A, putative, partial [Ixodes scapularis]